MAMALEKIMFEIYRNPDQEGEYRVVYFTELDEHSRQAEINNAMRGEHVYDGFIRQHASDQAKRVVNQVIKRLNSGEPMEQTEIERELKPYMA
jgi:hypothetical protein